MFSHHNLLSHIFPLLWLPQMDTNLLGFLSYISRFHYRNLLGGWFYRHFRICGTFTTFYLSSSEIKVRFPLKGDIRYHEVEACVWLHEGMLKIFRGRYWWRLLKVCYTLSSRAFCLSSEALKTFQQVHYCTLHHNSSTVSFPTSN